MIIALGGIIGGWSLYAKKGSLKYCYNFFGMKQFFVESTSALPEGRHQVRVEFEYDGGGPAKGGNVTLYIDGKPVGNGRVEQTAAGDLLGRRDVRHRHGIRIAGDERLQPA